MIINIQDDILKIQSLGLLDKLLTDKTTGQHIIWATDAYTGLGPRYGRSEQISPELITGPNSGIIITRARKEMEQQSSRTRQHGEVSTPFWVCQKMCDYADEMWNSKTGWQKYVDARAMEITCGEAPFLVSRYDAETGEAIPIPDRIGLLDRKLRAVNENAQSEDDWLKWAFRTFHATYGYEFQGDNLLIARINLLMTFEEYLWERWRRKPTVSEYGKLITVIVWNIWQMDGLQGTIPYGTAEEEFRQFNLFDFLDGMSEPDKENIQPRCRVYNWLGGGSVEYLALPIRGKRAMKFDFVIGNPPYQEETEGTSDKPIYNFFMDAVYVIADKAELITPARFLFNAGKTPKAWNRRMLEDSHLKVLYYEQDSSQIFSNTDIKGGIAITYRDKSADYGSMEVFIPNAILRGILAKVRTKNEKGYFSEIVNATEYYKLTKRLHEENPNAIDNMSKGHQFDLTSNLLDKNASLFFDNMPSDGEKYIRIYGRQGGKRVLKWVKASYIDFCEGLTKYKVIIPESNNSGQFGETLVGPIIGEPDVVTTQTFLSIGFFDTENEALAARKYISSKFARAMLGTLKITQHNKREVWKNVPLQDFSSDSDIDWTKSIPEIDQQLYKKYGLDESEIQFIETHVKEME